MRATSEIAMNASIVQVLQKGLASRGFTPGGISPNDTMTLDKEYLERVDLGELLEMLVARREKVFHSGGVIGQEVSQKGYDDVVLAIEAVRAALQYFLPP
jgi:hypothetical protein